MSEDTLNHGHGNHSVEFEREDLSTRAVFAFMIGLAVVGILIYFIIVGMYTFLDKYERAQMSTASPLVKTEEAREVTSRRPTQDEVEKTFRENGAPLLETDERGQLRDFVGKQEKQLNSYGWVDEQAGVARIPIERAMQLTVERGLPVLPEATANAAAPKVSTAKPAATPVAASKKQ